MRYTYSVIDEDGTEDMFNLHFDYPHNALTIANFCQLYWENTHIEGDSLLTEETFERFGGKVGEDTISMVVGNLTVRLTRFRQATQMFVVGALTEFPQVRLFGVTS